VNEYIRAVKARTPLCERYNAFLGVKLKVKIWVYPPDKRRRDLDNICKCVLDSVQKAGIIDDDYNIDCLILERREVVSKGRIILEIRELADERGIS